MEKQNWSLIFLALCLALAFSVSPVAAQQNCDRDEDGFIKNIAPCRRENPGVKIDCDDNDPSLTDNCAGAGACQTPDVKASWDSLVY